jgi:hypothetical protein
MDQTSLFDRPPPDPPPPALSEKDEPSTRRCPHCGAATVAYKHSLTLPLVSALQKLADNGGGPINLQHLGLTRNQWDNFQKLRYFGLVEQVPGDGGQTKTGVWQITDMGRRFLLGTELVKRTVWTYRGKVVRRDGDLVSALDVEERHYKKRSDCRKDGECHA